MPEILSDQIFKNENKPLSTEDKFGVIFSLSLGDLLYLKSVKVLNFIFHNVLTSL